MNYNERDIEHPSLISFVSSHKDIKSLLDVGSFYSYNTYANDLRPLVKEYVGIDILPDPITEKILDKYILGDVKDHSGKYDLVSCVSTIEHSGLSTYKKADYKKEQQDVFKKLIDLSNKYIFITFPYGLPALHPGEFANIDSEQLAKFRSMVKGDIKIKFYYSPAPQQTFPFEEISEKEANFVEYIETLGTRCVCVMEIAK